MDTAVEHSLFHTDHVTIIGHPQTVTKIYLGDVYGPLSISHITPSCEDIGAGKNEGLATIACAKSLC